MVIAEDGDVPQLIGLLRSCGEWPNGSRTTEQGDKFPPPHCRPQGSGKGIA
jgi:hypothetical protein